MFSEDQFTLLYISPHFSAGIQRTYFTHLVESPSLKLGSFFASLAWKFRRGEYICLKIPFKYVRVLSAESLHYWKKHEYEPLKRLRANAGRQEVRITVALLSVMLKGWGAWRKFKSRSIFGSRRAG